MFGLSVKLFLTVSIGFNLSLAGNTETSIICRGEMTDFNIRPLAATKTDSNLHGVLTEDISQYVEIDSVRSILESSPLLPKAKSLTYTVIKARMTESGTPSNALGSLPKRFLPGYVYQIRFAQIDYDKNQNSVCGWGLSTANLYGPGWRMRGTFLNSVGNLYEEGSLITGFMQNYKDGSIIDWFVEIPDDKTVDIYMAKDDESLGRGYHLTFDDNSKTIISDLLPAVSFTDATGMKMMIASYSPMKLSDVSLAYRTRETTVIAKDPLQIDGDWLATEIIAVNDGDTAPLEPSPVTEKMIFSFKYDEENNRYFLKSRCGNTLTTSFELIDAETGEVRGSGSIASTFMMPPENQRTLDQFAATVMSDATKIITEKMSLSLRDARGRGFSMIRYNQSFESVTKNPFVENRSA